MAVAQLKPVRNEFSPVLLPHPLRVHPRTIVFNAASEAHTVPGKTKPRDLQMELLFPNRIQVPKNSLGTLLGFAHLHSHVRVTGSCLVLGLQALGTHHCNPITEEEALELCSRNPNSSSTTHMFSILEQSLSSPCKGTLISIFPIYAQSWATSLPLKGWPKNPTCSPEP